MPLKDDNNVTQRKKSFVKSKTLTDKVRSPAPDNISVQRPKNMTKPATYDDKSVISSLVLMPVRK